MSHLMKSSTPMGLVGKRPPSLSQRMTADAPTSCGSNHIASGRCPGGIGIATGVILSALSSLVLSGPSCLAAGDGDRQTVILVVGAPGSDEYGQQFDTWATRWEEACQKAGALLVQIGHANSDGKTDREQLQQQLANEQQASGQPLWIVLIGHGTFDGRSAKFNLRGPDVSAQELAAWLKGYARPVALINCASASGPFINRLSGENRVILAATKSGFEHNYARFGDYFSQAIIDLRSDLDKDEQVSLLEAFLSASSQVAEFYQQEARLATENALLDDNGDQLGTPASWYHGVRATRTAKDGASPDGLRASQWHLVRSDREQTMPVETRTRRDELEQAIAQLRQAKPDMPEETYFERLERLMLDLARLYRHVEASESAASSSVPNVSDS